MVNSNSIHIQLVFEYKIGLKFGKRIINATFQCMRKKHLCTIGMKLFSYLVLFRLESSFEWPISSFLRRTIIIQSKDICLPYNGV